MAEEAIRRLVAQIYTDKYGLEPYAWHIAMESEVYAPNELDKFFAKLVESCRDAHVAVESFGDIAVIRISCGGKVFNIFFSKELERVVGAAITPE